MLALTHTIAGLTSQVVTTGQYDAASRRTRLAGPSGTADYQHDDTDQLTDAAYDYQGNENYVYDDNGNRVSGGYTVGPNNRMTSDDVYRYLYDEEGNRRFRFVDADQSQDLSGGDTDISEYTWDHRNQLTAVTHFADSTAYQASSPRRLCSLEPEIGASKYRASAETWEEKEERLGRAAAAIGVTTPVGTPVPPSPIRTPPRSSTQRVAT